MGKAYFPTFKSMFQTQNQAWDLKEVDGELLLGYYGGLASVGGEKLDKIHEWRITQPSYIHQLSKMPQYMFIGLCRGLSIMKKVNGRWTIHKSIETIKNRVVNIVEIGNNTYWIAMYDGKAYRLILNGDSESSDPFENIDLSLFGQDEGIPLNNVHAVVIDEKIKLGTQGGLKKFDEEKQRFVPDYSLGDQFADSTTWVYYINQDANSDVWIVAGNGSDTYNGKAIKQNDGSYTWYDTPYLRMNDMGDMYHIRPEEDGRIWFSGSEGIALYAPQDEQYFETPYSSKIHDVIDIRTGADLKDRLSESSFISLPYENNSIRLRFSALTYHNTEANRFQFKLDGFDENWSEWTSENRKDYTGIFEGDYTFRVRSKNIYNQIGDEAALNISIAPPWFRTMGAYFIYLLLGSGLIFALFQTRVRRYKKQQERLENMITERTAQIVEQRNQLAVQSEKLKELDELKSQFFANISHEFRTPLTLIIGMIDNLKKQAAETSSAKELALIEQNAGRLLNLINQLLDLSKLEASELKITVAENDIARFIRRIYASFASLAPQRKISMTLNGIAFDEVKEDSIKAWYDTDKLEKVFYNLLSNAFKFTPANGRVDLSYQVDSSSSNVTITVLNTGPGIPPEKLPHIFERFYQVEGSNKREFEGTGIGLALVRELVELHHGSVTAASKPDSDTTFTIKLPITRTAFDDEEIQKSPDDQVVSASTPNIAALSADDPYAPEDVSDTELEEAESDKTLILIVEDHRDLRRFIRESLEGEFSVIEAENGRVGVEKAVARIPDLIISDVMMPEMDGYELCASLKTNEKTDHIPIILLTAKAATDDKMEGLQTGADDYLLKPFNPEELQVRVRNLIKIRRQMRDKFSNEMLLRPTDITVSSVHQVFLEKVTGIIESHMDNEEFSVEGLANEVGMSRGQLHRKLKALTNQSTSEFIRNFRLQRAAELIKQNAGNIAEIAYEVGFSSQAYFTRCFQEQFNCSPTEYRKKHQTN
ncbi:MAG: ATP-binding protein, partial [Calditrichota bacterium]